MMNNYIYHNYKYFTPLLNDNTIIAPNFLFKYIHSEVLLFFKKTFLD